MQTSLPYIVMCPALVLTLSILANTQSVSPSSSPKSEESVFDCILDAQSKNRSRNRTRISLAAVYARAGRQDRALQLMRQAQEEAAGEPDPAQRAILPIAGDPDRLAIDLAQGYLEIGAWDHAIQFTRKITNAPFRARMLARIAGLMARADQKGKADALLAEARSIITSPTDEAWALAEISQGYAQLGECEKAREFALSMPDAWPYIKAPELARIGSQCAKNGCKQEASLLISESLRVAGLMSHKRLVSARYEVQALAASAQIDNGQTKSALKLLDEALIGAGKVEQNTRALELIADAYANAKLYKKAEDIAESIDYRASRADTLVDIARRYVSSGDTASALAILDRSVKISLDDKNGTATFRYKRIADTAVEYSKAGRADRAGQVLIEALRQLRREEYDRTELILIIFSGYARSTLVPDEAARELIGKLCSGEAFELTPEEEAIKRRVEEAADRFIERWHQTLDLNALFGEMYVSDAEQRKMNGRQFRGVYQFLAGSAWSPGVDRDVDDELLREAFFAFWNYLYMTDEYGLAHRTTGDELVEPPEFKQKEADLRRRRLPEKRMSRAHVILLRDSFEKVAAIYRKYLPANLFKSPTYLENLRRKELSEAEFGKRFRIEPGFPRFGVPDNVDVFYLKKGVFRFYFIEEAGKLKVLTLAFEL